MSNVTSVLNHHFRRLAGREIRANTKTVKKASAHFRRDIAALKRQVGQLTKLVKVIQRQIPRQSPMPPPEVVQNARLRIDGLKAHRARLGLSAKDYGKLMGVSDLTIYHWESGKTKPQRSQLPKIVAVRGIGKREAMQRLGMTAEMPQAKTAGKGRGSGSRKRGKFQQTGEQSILGLLKGLKAMTTQEINLAWKKMARGGTANVMLGLMTKARKLKRMKLKGQRGSEYSVA